MNYAFRSIIFLALAATLGLAPTSNSINASANALSIQPADQSTDPAPDTTAWDRLHPATQKYLEKNAKYYCYDDDGRLWYRKIYMEDEAALARLNRKAREARLDIRNSPSTPAWYCLDDGTKLSFVTGEHWYLHEFNKDIYKSRLSYIDEHNLSPFTKIETFEEFYGRGYIIVLAYDSAGNPTKIRLDMLPNAELFKSNEFIPLAYEMEEVGVFYNRSNGGFKYIPHYRVLINTKLDDLYPLYTPEDELFSPLTPLELAVAISDRNLTSLPEWRSRRAINPEYTNWKNAKNQRGKSPDQYIYTWTKKQIRLRFTD